MTRISATKDVLPGKATYRLQDAAQKQTAPAKTPSPQPAAPQAPAAAPKPSEKLQHMLNARQQGTNASLRAMIVDAGAELARQNEMIDDIDRILTMEKARKAYAAHGK